MDFKKVKAIINWQKPKNIKNIRAFIKFTDFYQQFINNFSTLILLHIALTQKNKAFIFNKKYKKAFTYLKVIFTTTPILQYFNLNKISVVKTN